MKVALVHMRHAATGGTERYLNQIAAYLAARGHAVRIVCRSHAEPPHPDVRFVRLRPLALGGAWRLWSFAMAVDRHVRAAAYDVVFGLGKTWTHDVLRLGGGCHRTYLELAHPATRAAWQRVVDRGLLKHRLALAIERRALAPGAYRRVITNSEMVRQDVMQRHGVPADRVTVIYNGVDLERFHPRRRGREGAELRRSCGLAAEDFIVLFLGTGYGRKGLDVLLDAFARLELPRARLLVVGHDSARRRFERHAERLGLGGRVLFLGGRRDTPACYAAADLYVLPTRYDPFASTTLEALASGLPVVTTAANGAGELIEEGVQGSVLARADDRVALGERLLSWADAERRRVASGAARALAERHSEATTVEASTRVLEELARGRPAAPAGGGVP
jgi:UDP-glucose:(heptosyl)LPS alpha-1,3-glucosyltransferase